MLTQLYSLRPLSQELRGTFEIPGDPFSSQPGEVAKAQNYLQNLGIFFYRDEEIAVAYIIEPDDGAGSILDRTRFSAYKSLVDLDPDYFKVVEWDLESPIERQKRIKKNGDLYAWLRWNQSRFVLAVSETEVKVS